MYVWKNAAMLYFKNYKEIPFYKIIPEIPLTQISCCEGFCSEKPYFPPFTFSVFVVDSICRKKE